MHRGLSEGNTKLVLILFSALGPSDLGPGLRLRQRILLSSGDVHLRLQHRVLHVHTCISSVPKSGVIIHMHEYI